MTVTNQRLVEILTTAMEKPEIANALIQRVINTLNKQPEPEPVAWMHDSHVGFNVPLYTAPPQREWQGLTENEIKHLWYEACQTNLELTSQLIVHLARNIEAKLKEKNT